MKQHINKLVIFVIISFFIVQFGNRSTEAQEPVDLITLASVLRGEKITVDKWSMHAREIITTVNSQADLEKYVKSLQKKFPNWEWTFSENGKKWEVNALSQDQLRFEEKIRIVSTPVNQRIQAYIIYELKGDNWGEETEQFLKTELSSTFSTIFRGNPAIFSCISADLGGKIDRTLSTSINGLLKAFNANEIESLKEESFVSVSAISPLFADSINQNDKSMNLQLALRSQGLGTKTTLVVGTPIITIEY